MEKTHVVNENDPIFDISTKPITNNTSISQMNCKDVYPLNRINTSFDLGLNGKSFDFQITESDINYDKSYMWFDVSFYKKIGDTVSAMDVNISIPPFLTSVLIDSIYVKLNNSTINYFSKNSSDDFRTHFYIHTIENKSRSFLNSNPQYAIPFGYDNYIYENVAATRESESSLMENEVKQRRNDYVNFNSHLQKYRFILPFEYIGLSSNTLNVNKIDIRITFVNSPALDKCGGFTLKAANSTVNGVAFISGCQIVDHGIRLTKNIRSQSEIARSLKLKNESKTDILSYIDHQLHRFTVSSQGTSQLNIPSIPNVLSVKMLQFADKMNNYNDGAKIYYTSPCQTFIGNAKNDTALTVSKYTPVGSEMWNNIKMYYGSLSYPDEPLEITPSNLIDVYHEYLRAVADKNDPALNYQDFIKTNPIVYLSLFDSPKMSSRQNIQINFTKNTSVSEDIFCVVSRIKTILVNADQTVVEAE